MTKRENIDNPNSCWNKAADDATVFVLKDTDPVFTETVRFWAAKRVEYGIDPPDSPKIRDAVEMADEVEVQGK